MRKVVKIEGIPLTEGHSGLYLDVEDGIVKRGLYFALVPVRGFETLLIGREASVAPVLTSRICGLCQITHSIASAKAIESAAGIEIPPEAEVLREVLGLAVRIYNNLLHQIMVSEDLFLKKDDRFLFIREVQRVRKFVARLLESAGGEIIHSPNIVVGGISEPFEDFVKEKFLKEGEEVLGLLESNYLTFREAVDELWRRESLEETLGSHNLEFFSTDLYYGKEIDFNRFSFRMPQEIFEGELKRRVSNLYPLLNGKPVETGPRARAVFFKGYKPKGGIKELHILRGEENVEALKRILELLESNSFSGELRNRRLPISDGETLGVGVHEAPRGTNVHAVKIDKSGKIIYYKIVVPTEINFWAISESLKGVEIDKVEYVVRAYDPCIVCASH
ncbi:coenzyme F420-reducing hydrogenase, alpha subunit [Balnearium lithotrophicum]|uniref:Coenzyme F420-reducing hydrogenase, alpha subunit n=1 Tax=Balnearium lithotrophicum TaxID=223788 RepID=A0A521DAF6_9BACT|nr:nickel-dependent hydrogenase large subunit [Balnearium lithotrophicum]SMO68694.1 coenzyme F420-reducing hydrogenase, alpha subunit [Balnearium lithotrophicum]